MALTPVWILISVGCLFSLLIALQDFRQREIHLLPVSGFILCGILYHVAVYPSQSVDWQDAMLNVLIIAIIMLVIFLFYRIKGEKRIMDTKLGWGDLVIWLGLAIWMPTPIFILFFAFCMIGLTLIVGILLLIGRIDTQYPIPLAGSMCFVFAFFFPLWQYNQPFWTSLWI